MQGNVQSSGNVRFKARSEHAVSSALKDGSVNWYFYFFFV